MAEGGQPRPVQDGDQEYAFRNVELYKNETLGTGSYGAVCKAKCDELICAAKLLYPVLFEMQPQAPEPGKEHRQPFCRFELECRFLSRINHPNIVQYLGTYRDPDTNAPVLLMELMDKSLTHFLESSPGPIPYHVQVNLCYDIAQALAFLHSNGIIHRDLSSNNVLLLGNRAKVTDFGMSKFTNIAATRLATMTMCPGTPAFMSPEALNEPPVYTEMIDIFSLGVVMIQIDTRLFPQPSERFRTKEVIDPASLGRRVRAQLPVPEVERRHTHIRLVDLTHPLLSVACKCLRDNERERPSSPTICGILSSFKETSKYKTSAVIKNKEIKLLKSQIKIKEKQLNDRTCEIQQLKESFEQVTAQTQEKQEELDEKADFIKAKEQQVQLQKTELQAQAKLHQENNRKLEENEMLITALKKSLAEVTVTGDLTKQQYQTKATRSLRAEDTRKVMEYSERRTTIRRKLVSWSHPEENETKNVQKELACEYLPGPPVNLIAGTSTVVGSKAYFQSKGTQTVHEYDSIARQWSRMLPHPLFQCSLVSIDHNLASVGGYNIAGTSNRLYRLKDDHWVESLPPMPTKRASPTVVHANDTLIVAGGQSQHPSILKIVEVLDTQSKQWTTVSPLPFPAFKSSAILNKDTIYMTAGEGSYHHPKYSVLSCSLPRLLRTAYCATPQSDTSATCDSPALPPRSPWRTISDLPVHGSSLAVIKGDLLAVGGLEDVRDHSVSSSRPTRTRTIYRYDETNSRWETFGETYVPRSHCFAEVIPNDKLMVVGGTSTTNTVECFNIYNNIM